MVFSGNYLKERFPVPMDCFALFSTSVLRLVVRRGFVVRIFLRYLLTHGVWLVDWIAGAGVRNLMKLLYDEKSSVHWGDSSLLHYTVVVLSSAACVVAYIVSWLVVRCLIMCAFHFVLSSFNCSKLLLSSSYEYCYHEGTKHSTIFLLHIWKACCFE